MLADAARLDAAEDAAYGPDRRGDELPAEWARRYGPGRYPHQRNQERQLTVNLSPPEPVCQVARRSDGHADSVLALVRFDSDRDQDVPSARRHL